MKKLHFILMAIMPFCAFGQSIDTEKLMEVCEKGIVNVFTESGQGSGFVVNKKGYLITNFHVIADRYGQASRQVEIKFKDERTYTANVVDYNENYDLALLKISPDEPLTALPILAGKLPKEGAEIITIGNGKGLGFAIIDCPVLKYVYLIYQY